MSQQSKRPSKQNSSPARERAEATQHDVRWQAVLARDAAKDGSFVFGVRTTGIYCRPSCHARRPRPENVTFFADGAAARRAGLRACKRCLPDAASPAQRQARLIARLCRFLEDAERLPRLADLAVYAGMSPCHVQRWFRTVVGITPRVYAAAHRRDRARQALGKCRSVTAAMYASGYESTGSFHADLGLGMTAKSFRGGARGERIVFAVSQCSLGSILVAATVRGVCAILLGDDPNELAQDVQRRFPRAEFVGGDAAFERTVARVVAFVDRPLATFDVPMDIRGTAFQQQVWQVLRGVGVGQVIGYAEIARRLGLPRAARAVAQACAANTLAVAIPCHRVVRTDGALAGYRWGVERKRDLLAREQAGLL